MKLPRAFFASSEVGLSGILGKTAYPKSKKSLVIGS